MINPIGDRRLEARFESRENVVVRLEQGDKVIPAVGYEIGRFGMKLETHFELEMGSYVQVAFPNAADHVRCFGRVVWSRPARESGGFECGLSLESWHGIVEGEESWKKYQGGRSKSERRIKPR